MTDDRTGDQRQVAPEEVLTISEFVKATALAYDDSPAVALDGESVTFRDIEHRSARIAEGLLSRGVPKGARIGLLLGNGPDWVVLWAAITRIGAVAVALSTFARAGELERTIRHADLHGLFMQPEHLGRDLTIEMERAFPSLAVQHAGELMLTRAPFLRWVVVDGDAIPSWALGEDWAKSGTASPELRAAAEAEVHVDDPAMVIYTSGSSATPKGVVHSQGSVMSKVHYLRRMLEIHAGAHSVAEMPFFWVGGLVMSLLTTLEAGGLVECHSKSTYRAAPLGSVTPQSNPLAHLRLSPALGMTETFGMYSWGTTQNVAEYPIAAPLDVFEPGYDVLVVDAVGQPVADGQVGEIIVRGPTVTRQLVKVERAAVFRPDGYFHTGDRGVPIDGRIYFVGRAGDMIKTSGANVAPPEVERELITLRGVEAAFVTGLDDAQRGQIVAAAVIAVPGDRIDIEVLRDQLKERLSPYKVPRRMVAISWNELPMTPSRKVDRRALAQLITERLTE